MERVDLAKLPRDEAVKFAIDFLKLSPTDAELVVALARGEVDGDVIKVKPNA
jgi:hypothetical protein